MLTFRGLNKQYYEEFIVPNEEVDRHLELTGYFGEVCQCFDCPIIQSIKCRTLMKLDCVELHGGKLPRLYQRA